MMWIVHERIVKAGLDVMMPLENHPWGDRGFAVTDPNGIALYIYSERDPAKSLSRIACSAHL